MTFSKIGSAELDISKIININCKSADGIIGSNLMKRCIWQIDYDNRKISFSDNISTFKNLETATKINFTPSPVTGTPILKVNVNDTTFINLILDTGFNGFISFNTQDSNLFLKSFDLNNSRIVSSIGYNNVYGTDTIKNTYNIIRVNITIGDKNFGKLPITFGRYKNVSGRKNGVIGNDFFKNFIVTIDWLENVIYLNPGVSNQLKDNLITYGIKYGFENNKLIIGSIIIGSEAEKIGLQIGDEIIFFNGQDIKSLSQKDRCIFNDNNEPTELNKQLKLTIRKNEQKVDYVLTSYLLFN